MTSPFLRASVRLRLTLVLCLSVFAAACDSGSNAGSDAGPAPEWDRPDITNLNTQNRSISNVSSAELLTNPVFANELQGWTACNNDTQVTVEGNTAVLRNENCIHQAVEIIPAQELTMSCSVSRYGTEPQWSGLSFSYYDENWNFISEPNAAQITGLSYNQYTVTDTAPLNAKYAGVWIYTSTGVGVRSCSFKSGGGTTQPPEPPQPPSSNELLSNPNFNNQLSGWSRCNNNSGLSVQGNVAVLNSANCLHQDLDAFASQSFNLSCQARQLSDNDWTGVGLSFYDASWNFISEPSPTQVSNGSFSDYNVSGTAPATARYIAANHQNQPSHQHHLKTRAFAQPTRTPHYIEPVPTLLY